MTIIKLPKTRVIELTEKTKNKKIKAAHYIQLRSYPHVHCWATNIILESLCPSTGLNNWFCIAPQPTHPRRNNNDLRWSCCVCILLYSIRMCCYHPKTRRYWADYYIILLSYNPFSRATFTRQHLLILTVAPVVSQNAWNPHHRPCKSIECDSHHNCQLRLLMSSSMLCSLLLSYITTYSINNRAGICHAGPINHGI